MTELVKLRCANYDGNFKPSEVTDGVLAFSIRDPRKVYDESTYYITVDDLQDFVNEMQPLLSKYAKRG